MLRQAMQFSIESRKQLVARRRAPRGEWLEGVRATSPDLATTLLALLSRYDQIDKSGFLETRPAVTALTFPIIGQTVTAYTLERPLGYGGMGAV